MYNMGLFRRKEEEQFDAFETNRSETLKLIGIFILVAAMVVLIAFFGYTAYIHWTTNETATQNYSDLNFTNATPINPTTNITVQGGKNVTSPLSADGIYYYATREKVIGETCYIDDKKVDCDELTSTRCSEDECRKDLKTITECFINNQQIECP
jgi:hypothetical protein